MILYLCCFLIFIEKILGAKLANCPPDQIKFEKIVGLRPKRPAGLLLFQDPRKRPTTLQCLSKCASFEDCTGFVLDYRRSTCYWYRDEIGSYDEVDNIIDGDVSWFVKTCLNVHNCTKQWVFERSPGATLIGNDLKALPYVVTRRECQQNCLDETRFNCRSAKFTVGHRNGSETVGRCVLSDTDRHLIPSSFRVSRSDEEYFDNQCSKAFDEKFCPFEEYDDISLSHADFLYENRTKEDCENLCQTFDEFNCRGYSTWPHSRSPNTRYTCLIHSEDSKLLGPKLLADKEGATHYEKAPCLNITVTCSTTDMIIRYTPTANFYGKIYMKGYSENAGCYVKGRGVDTLTLRISLKIKQCGVQQAISNTNSTLFHSTMILQHNNLVQTQADRVIRVGCIYGNVSNVVVGTGVNFTGDLPNNGATIINSTTTLPTISMRIVDFYTHEEVSETQIGQELELVIEVNSQNDSFDISAGHLIAMTPNSEDSILLLDDRGCPTNLNVFPALTKISDGSVKRLVGAFQAFKFSSSPIIRFSVMVMFCQSECPMVDCGYYAGNNRVKRNAVLRNATNGTEVRNVEKQRFDNIGREIVREMPLELVIMVRNRKDITSDKLIFGESNRILIADYETKPTGFFRDIDGLWDDANLHSRPDKYIPAQWTGRVLIVNACTNEQTFCLDGCAILRHPINRPFVTKSRVAEEKRSFYQIDELQHIDNQKVCVDYSLFIAFIVLWVFVLLVLVGASFFIVRRYKKHYKNLCVRQSMEELNKNFGLDYSNFGNRRVHFANDSDLS